MKLILDLPTDVSIALRRLSAGDRLAIEEAAVMALRDWMISHGYLELESSIPEEIEVAGSDFTAAAGR